MKDVFESEKACPGFSFFKKNQSRLFFCASVADRMLVLCVYGNLAFTRILNLCKVSCADAAVKK